MKQHLTPCKECPFRKASAPGWLGADSPEGFIATAETEARMPCHLLVDYERPDWERQAVTVPQCAGRAIYLKNKCKLPYESWPLLNLVRNVERSTEVFARAQDFLDHHRRNK